ncbi:hypothetical protein N836_08455 [Leptolyngbya sp. Heron Island J]|uniref:hypothetical protein n=1 Tax=Leptolyngbya sp. Heron Island J TaxID=1385935 RepID=UPI0003B9B4E0|nr:hypothetical protein [Leptolyngbya sp. Heron Island J]ESA36170.1 hypothetical protein N836_08455 [Leptolyngbya sp. Heron Island J]
MSSGIFAVANIGKYRLYVGETHQLKTRWAKMMAMFVQGTFPSKKIQQAWQESGKERRFTFHTAQQISEEKTIFNYRQFLKDMGADDT